MSLFTDNDAYEISSDYEVDMLLADLPLSLIKESIKDQIDDPLSTNVNYVIVILEKCEVLKRDFENNSDAINSINSTLRSFFEFVIGEIDKKFDLKLNLDDEDDETYNTIGEILYKFLILRYKKNINKFIIKYILKNKKSICENFEKQAKKKDVTSISLKKQMKNKDNILILSNLPSVIKHIMNLYVEPLDFLKYACDDENYEGRYIKQMVSDGKIMGNFITNYFNLIVDEYNDILDEIQTNVKLKLMEKL